MIDTLKYSRQLEEAGFDTKQSELLVRSQIAMITDNVATKMDIKELSHRIEVMNSRFDLRLTKMTNRLSAIVISSISIIATLLGIFLKYF